MTTNAFGLSIKDIESLVTYPPRARKQAACEPHKNEVSKKLLTQYKASVAARNAEREKLKMHTTSKAKAVRSSSATLLAEGQKLMQDGRNDEALSCMLEAVRMGDQEASTFAQIGSLYAGKALHLEAINYLTKAVVVDPMNADYYFHRAESYIALDQPAEAFAEMEKHFKLVIPSKDLLVQCGKCALDAGLLDSSHDYLHQALKMPCESDSPEAISANKEHDAYAWYNLGELEEKRNNDAMARACYAHVCRSDANFPKPYIAQAEDEFEQGNNAMALHLYEAVAKMLPEDPEVFVRLADIYEALGDEFASSIHVCLTKAIELNGNEKDAHADALVRRGTLLLEAFAEIAKAISDFSVCLELDPRHTRALEYRAKAFRMRCDDGDRQAAIADYKLLISLSGVDWSRKREAYRYLAVTAYDDNNLADAHRYFSLAIVCGGSLEDEQETLQMYVSAAHACSSRGVDFDEAYEPRSHQNPKDHPGQAAKKGEPVFKPFPVLPLAYQLIEAAYLRIREREPTVHSGVEYALIDIWKPFHDEVERRKEEVEAARGGKKGGKKK